MKTGLIQAGLCLPLLLPFLCCSCDVITRSLEDELVGRSYYSFEENYTCGNVAGETVASWTDAVSFSRNPENGKLMASFWGDRCNDTIETIPFAPAEFTFSPDLSTLTYEGKVYEYHEEIPQF